MLNDKVISFLIKHADDATDRARQQLMHMRQNIADEYDYLEDTRNTANATRHIAPNLIDHTITPFMESPWQQLIATTAGYHAPKLLNPRFSPGEIDAIRRGLVAAQADMPTTIRNQVGTKIKGNAFQKLIDNLDIHGFIPHGANPAQRAYAAKNFLNIAQGSEANVKQMFSPSIADRVKKLFNTSKFDKTLDYVKKTQVAAGNKPRMNIKDLGRDIGRLAVQEASDASTKWFNPKTLKSGLAGALLGASVMPIANMLGANKHTAVYNAAHNDAMSSLSKIRRNEQLAKKLEKRLGQ